MDVISILNRQEAAILSPAARAMAGVGVSTTQRRKSKWKIGKGSKTILVVIFIAVLLIGGVLAAGLLVPAMILENLINPFGQAYTTEVKVLVLQEALKQGDLPTNTAKRLKQNGTPVGYIQDGTFVELSFEPSEVASTGIFYEGNSGRELAIKVGDTVVSANDFYTEANRNVSLWNSIQKSTYGDTGFVYDESAKRYYASEGISLTKYSGDKDYEEAMTEILGGGNNISVYGRSSVCEETIDADGNAVQYCTSGDWQDSSLGNGSEIINNMNTKNRGSSIEEGTLNTADALATASTTTSGQTSEKFYVEVMKNISMMKAGDGNSSWVNSIMNTMFETYDKPVVDVDNGEIITTKGSMLESPSLYAMITKTNVSQDDVKNYASNRILRTVENLSNNTVGSETLNSSVVSVSTSSTKMARVNLFNSQAGSMDILNAVSPIVQSSMVDNSFDDIRGIPGGELLAAGAINVWSGLSRYSGSTLGDRDATIAYGRLTNSVVALNEEADRLNRSPFDITSKNTFLGSIVYKFGISTLKSGSIFNKMASVARVTASTFHPLIPNSNADDGSATFYNNFGDDCERYAEIGAVATAGCYNIEVFDPTSLGSNAFSSQGFISVVENNTRLEGGVRRINENSLVGEFLENNAERTAPAGVIDADILGNGSFLDVIVNFFTNGSNQENIKKASGEEYVNSSANPNWEEYKYVQLYIAANRVVSLLREYDGDSTAYTHLKFFEGAENPVIAYLNNNHNVLANNN